MSETEIGNGEAYLVGDIRDITRVCRDRGAGKRLRRMEVSLLKSVLEHYKSVNGLHTMSCWKDQQWIDVQFGQTSIELHPQVGDVDQGLRQRLDVRRRPSTEPVQHACPFDVGQHSARFRLGNGTAT